MPAGGIEFLSFKKLYINSVCEFSNFTEPNDANDFVNFAVTLSDQVFPAKEFRDVTYAGIKNKS